MNPFAGITVELIYDFLNRYVLPRDPGSAWEYSNFGVGLLGHVLPLETGLEYEDLVVDRIADDLGLADTRVRLSTEQLGRMATGYSGVVEIPPFEMGALGGPGALRSTAADLPVFLAPNRGWLPGPWTSAMTNAQAFRASSIPLTTPRTPSAVSEVALRRFVGQYRGVSGDTFDFDLQDGHLILRYLEDVDLPLTLYAASENRLYLAALAEAGGTFVTNTLGRAIALSWHQNGQTSSYPRTPVAVRLAIGQSDDGLRIRLSGEGDRPYIIEASSDLRTWTAIFTNTIWHGPVANALATVGTQRFYRALEISL